MKKSLVTLAVLLVAVALVAACGGGASSQSGTSGGATGAGEGGGTGVGASTPATSGGGGGAAAAGDPNAGETLFASATIGSNPGCKTCHSLDGSKLVGPTMQGYAARAGNEVQGQSDEEYTRASIIDPNAHVVEGYTAGVMPSFRTVLSDTQLNDLVAYLLSLK